jgi:hypothetical protein
MNACAKCIDLVNASKSIYNFRWEVDPNYCANTVMRTPPYSRGPRLMSIIDTAIFDYFIGKLYSLFLHPG